MVYRFELKSEDCRSSFKTLSFSSRTLLIPGPLLPPWLNFPPSKKVLIGLEASLAWR
jgi:hypothetical protein